MMPRIHGDIIFDTIISNKAKLAPREPKAEPSYLAGVGWYGGYEFRQFLGNCYACLGDIAKMEGMQQLCHQYYLQNGSIGARYAASRVLRFLEIPRSNDRATK